MFQDQKDINAKKEMFYLTMHLKRFYLQLYCIGHMVKNQSDSERENLLLTLHGLLILNAQFY